MKIPFHFCKIVTACLFIFSIFPSCIPSIRIVGGNTTTGDLDMRDAKGNSASTFLVDQGQKIDWKIIKHLKVSSITGMSEEAKTHNNVFSKDSHKKALSKKWKGKIDKKAEGAESYNIEWKDEEGKSHTYDPKIQVKSR